MDIRISDLDGLSAESPCPASSSATPKPSEGRNFHYMERLHRECGICLLMHSLVCLTTGRASRASNVPSFGPSIELPGGDLQLGFPVLDHHDVRLFR